MNKLYFTPNVAFYNLVFQRKMPPEIFENTLPIQ